jgi:glucosylceramidase
MKVKDITTKEPWPHYANGQLNPDHYQDYAEYFVRWIKAFEDHGIKIWAVTPQSDPLFRAGCASMFMPWQQQANFIKTALGPKLASSDTKIYCYDYNYDYAFMEDQMHYPLKIYEDPEASKYVAGCAWHGYRDNPGELEYIREANPDKEMIFTEVAIQKQGRSMPWQLLLDMRGIVLDAINNGCRSYISWNYLLDMDGNPYQKTGACPDCIGAIDIEKDYRVMHHNSHYYCASHFSAVLRYGARRVQVTASSELGLAYTAFENPDGSLALVVMNDLAEDRIIRVLVGGKQVLNETLYQRTVMSYHWKN